MLSAERRYRAPATLLSGPVLFARWQLVGVAEEGGGEKRGLNDAPGATLPLEEK